MFKEKEQLKQTFNKSKGDVGATPRTLKALIVDLNSRRREDVRAEVHLEFDTFRRHKGLESVHLRMRTSAAALHAPR